MKTVKLSLSLRTTSDIFASSQRKASATFCLTVISLSLLSFAARSLEQTPDWTSPFERHRPGPRNDWNFRFFLKAREMPALHHSDSISKKDVLMIISRHHADSARFPRISKIRANQQDSSESARLTESARLQESDRYPTTASHERVIALHSLPQLEGLSPVGVSSSRGPSDLFAFVGY